VIWEIGGGLIILAGIAWFARTRRAVPGTNSPAEDSPAHTQ
jgi:hypothetical protein